MEKELEQIETDLQKEYRIVVDSINEQVTILELARRLRKTVVETSRALSFYTQNDKFRNRIEGLGWPVNIDRGHIYTGSFATEINDKELGGALVQGERNGDLAVGDYVLKGHEVFREKGHSYSFIYKPEKTTEYLVYFYDFFGNDSDWRRLEFKRLLRRRQELENEETGEYLDPSAEAELAEINATINDFKKNYLSLKVKKYFSTRDMDQSKHIYFGKSEGAVSMVISEEKREVYRKGMSLGTTDLRNLRSVNL